MIPLIQKFKNKKWLEPKTKLFWDAFHSGRLDHIDDYEINCVSYLLSFSYNYPEHFNREKINIKFKELGLI